MTNTETLDNKRTMFTGGRDYSVDVLRCISCFMVVTGHVTNFMLPDAGYSTVATGSITCYLLLLARATFTSATNIFLMISGIFFLSPERNVTIKKIWSKNILKMTCAYILWSFLYAYFRIFFEDPQPFSVHTLLKEALIEEQHLWYIPMMIGIYIVVPLMRVFTIHAKKYHYYYLLILFAMGSILKTIDLYCRDFDFHLSNSILLITEKTPMNLLCTFPLFCIAGYFFYTYKMPKTVHIIVYLAGIIGILFSFYACIHMQQVNGELESDVLHAKFAFGNFAKSIAIFLLVTTALRNVNFSKVFRKFISKLSAATLFIYLFHWMMMMFLFKTGFLMNSDINGLLLALIYITFIYFTGFLISLVFLQFIPWVKMRNVVLDKIWPNRTIYVTKRKS